MKVPDKREVGSSTLPRPMNFNELSRIGLPLVRDFVACRGVSSMSVGVRRAAVRRVKWASINRDLTNVAADKHFSDAASGG